MMFGLLLVGIIFLVIILVVLFSTKGILKNKKQNQVINPIYIFLIVFGLLFLLNSLVNGWIISSVTIIVGMLGNIYNFKNRKNKYFVLGVIIYLFILLYGVVYLCFLF